MNTPDLPDTDDATSRLLAALSGLLDTKLHQIEASLDTKLHQMESGLTERLDTLQGTVTGLQGTVTGLQERVEQMKEEVLVLHREVEVLRRPALPDLRATQRAMSPQVVGRPLGAPPARPWTTSIRGPYVETGPGTLYVPEEDR